MLCPSSRSFDLSLIVVLVALFAMSTLPASAQHSSQGMVSVTVFDPTGASLPGARLELVDVATNDARTATTQENGGYSFVNLPIGTYKLTVSRDGYATQVFETVVVHATQVTDASVTLKVAQVQQTVQVTATNSPLVEATSSEIGTVIDMKQIEDLPLGGRDLQQLTRLVPGYTGNASEGGTWNGLPGGAQGSNFKSLLQQVAQREFGATPRYDLLDEQGPDHHKCFKVAAIIGKHPYTAAWGRNKKEAEQKAAMNALAQISGEPIPFEAD